MSAYDGDRPDAEHDGGRRRHRLSALVDAGITSSGGPPWRDRLERVCTVVVAQVAVDGAGVTVMGSREAGLAGHRDQLAATGPLTRRLDDLQLTVGEGPCLDAYAFGTPALAGDLITETTRWLGFAPEAVAAGARAVFSLPLQVGAVRLGTLDMHRTVAGPLSREQLADALALATIATEALLELADDPDPDDPDPTPLRSAAGWLSGVHTDVHVASGMVSAQAGIGVDAALLRLRAHAFVAGEPIGAVARRIIDRDLVLDHPDTRARSHDDDGPQAPDPENEP